MFRSLVLLAVGFTGAAEGRSGIDSIAEPGTKAVVLFFVASDCPISNRIFPEMRRVREEFAGERVRFRYVYPNATEEAKAVVRHQAEYDAGGEAMVGRSGDLVRLAGVKVTPEVAVLIPVPAGGWRTVYAGRIDDRYVRLGQERPQATMHFAERAIQAVLEGRPVEAATGVPVGCAIVPSAGQSRR